MEAPYNHAIRPQFLAPNAMVDTISKHRELYSWEAKRKYQPEHHTENFNCFSPKYLIPNGRKSLNRFLLQTLMTPPIYQKSL